MSKRYAHITLGLLIVLFILGVVDAAITPHFQLVPEPLAKAVTAILTGVAIGAILAGLRSNGANAVNIHNRDAGDRDDES